MKHLISALTLTAVLAGGAAAGAATSSAEVQIPAKPGTHLILINPSSGEVVGEYVAIFTRATTPTSTGAPATEPRRAFSDVQPLTVQQANEAAERALESQGPPLHTP